MGLTLPPYWERRSNIYNRSITLRQNPDPETIVNETLCIVWTA